MQNKNTLLFFVVCAVMLFVWIEAQNFLQPPKKVVSPPKKPAVAEQKKPEIGGWDKLSSPAQDDLKAAICLVGQGAVAGGPADLLQVTGALFGFYNRDKKVTPPTEKLETVILGGPNHHLVVTLTTKGAGVQKLVLNKFKAANWLGQPSTDKSDLELIPDDPYMPSFLMYHYEGEDLKNFSDKFSRPVSVLGDRNWKKEAAWEEDDDHQFVRFSTELPERQIRIEKTYGLKPKSYHLEMSLKIIDTRPRQGPGASELNFFPYQLTGGHGLPIEGDWYTGTYRTAVMGAADANNNLGAPAKEESASISHRAGGNRVPEDSQHGAYLQFAGVMNQYFASVIVVDDNQAKKNEVLAWARPTLESIKPPDDDKAKCWVGKLGVTTEKKVGDTTETKMSVSTQYGIMEFYTLPIVAKHLKEAHLTPGDTVTVHFYETSDHKKIATWVRRGNLPRPELDDITVRVHSQKLKLTAGDEVEHKFLLYHGPSKVSLLYQLSADNGVSPELSHRYVDTLNLWSMTDYGRFNWGIFQWSTLLTACSKLMHFLLYYLRFFGDGLSILMLTVLVRGLMFPISRKQAVFSVRMQALAPELKKIQEKYKDDAKAKTEATMELYRKHNVHPLGGCLPVLLQMPIFIGLYFALQESIHFRLASFLWMKNLAAPDMLIYWTEKIPWLSDPDSKSGILGFLYLGPFFNLLPVIAVGLMIVQQKVMTPPAQDEQQAAQMKMMRYMMVVIGLMFYKIAAGLGMYIIISTLWGLAERQFLPKKKPVLPGQPSAIPPAGTKPGSNNRKPPSKSPPAKKNKQMEKVKDWWQDVLKQARKK